MRPYYDHEAAYRRIAEQGGESELDAELESAGFHILLRERREDLESAIGDSLVRVARRRQ